MKIRVLQITIETRDDDHVQTYLAYHLRRVAEAVCQGEVSGRVTIDEWTQYEFSILDRQK